MQDDLFLLFVLKSRNVSKRRVVTYVFTSVVVDRTHYSRIFQFPLRINVKISEHAPNFNVFKPRLVCSRILILPSGSSGKKIRFFNNLTHTANLVIGLKFRKSLKFSKKSEILGFEKFRENYFNFFVL